MVAIALYYMFAGHYSRVEPPKRPNNVPNSAAWAGGADGGIWICCNPAPQEGIAYNCVTYNDYTGEIESQGLYLLCKIHWDNINNKANYLYAQTPIMDLQYTGYDGIIIRLKDDFALVPHGWIIHPIDSKHGKKQEYREGVPVSKEIEY